MRFRSVLEAWVEWPAESGQTLSWQLARRKRAQAGVKPKDSEGDTQMAEKFVAKLAEFQDGDRRIVFEQNANHVRWYRR